MIFKEHIILDLLEPLTLSYTSNLSSLGDKIESCIDESKHMTNYAYSVFEDSNHNTIVNSSLDTSIQEQVESYLKTPHSEESDTVNSPLPLHRHLQR